jgi:hypothetical protein
MNESGNFLVINRAIIISPLLVAFLALLTVTLPAKEINDMVFKYMPGGIYKYRTTSTFTAQQEVNDAVMHLSGSSSSLMKMEVVSVTADGKFNILAEYEEMQMHIKSPLMDTLVDQKDHAGIRSLVVMNKFGREISRESPDSAIVAASGFSMFIGYNQPASLFQLPEHPVDSGGSWSAEIKDSTAVGGSFHTETGTIRYIMGGYEDKNGHRCRRIVFALSSDYSGKVIQMGMDVFLEGTRDAKGTIWFDPASGIMVRKESNEQMDLTMALTGSMTMSIPMTENIKSTITLVEK